MVRPSAIGIDLGTTYCAVSRLNGAGHSEMILNYDGEVLTPSVVLFEDDQTFVGKEARRRGVTKADRLAEAVKRDMGSAVCARPIRGEYLPPEVIQACVLRQLREDIVRVVGPDHVAVITVPAYFDEPRRKATADAGEMAGLDVLDIVNEPTAAALAFGEDLGYLTPAGEPREPLSVLVYDLGGGTFDVTLIRLAPGDVRTLATDGDVLLGGRDWDQRLAEYAADAFAREHGDDVRGDPANWQRLLVEVEEAKRTLTARQQAIIRVEHAGRFTAVPVTRELFEELTADLLERTAYTTRLVLKTARLKWPDVSRILLVGGSSRMPMVGRMIQQLSGIVPERTVNPDEAVARGAAIYAGYLLAKRDGDEKRPDFEVTDVNAHSLGIEGVDPRTGARRNAILIPRNTPLPVAKTREFITRMANQRSIALRVLEGESTCPDDCTAIGRTVIDDLPVGLPQGWPIKVTYQYGANGRLSVRGAVPGTDSEILLEIQRERGMDGQQLMRWARAVEEDAGLDPFEAVIAQELRARQSATAEIANEIGVSAEPAHTTAGPDAEPTDSDTSLPAAAPEGEPEFADLPDGDELAFAPSETVSESPSDNSMPSISEPRYSSRARPQRSVRSAVLQAIGHLLFSLLGLALGYYILCWLKPEANFLDLPLPGL